jgi:purine nucleoside phosphorylase
MPAVAAIVGSAFASACPWPLEPIGIATAHGPWTLHRVRRGSREAFVSFRHGHPHTFLPHQIPWRAQAAALAEVGVGALLVTSSAGVLDPALPLHAPIVVGDLLMLDNRLPDGTACTMWPEPHPEHGHLVYDEGPLSERLLAQLRPLWEANGPLAGPAVFGWQLGPRIKTAAENRMWRQLGAQVDSMTLAPEVVLANELGIATVAVVVGHKHSGPDAPALSDDASVDASLRAGRDPLLAVIDTFLHHAEPTLPGNALYRFRAES